MRRSDSRPDAGASPSPLSSDARRRLVLDTMTTGFCVIEMLFDADGRPVDYRYVDVNDVFEAQTGLHDPVGRTIRELVPGIPLGWIERYATVLATRTPLKVVDMVASIGRWFEVEALPLDGPHVALLFRDATGQRNAEAAQTEAWSALQASREQLRFALDSVDAGLFDWDMASGALEWDRRTREIYGVDAEETSSVETLLAHMHEDDRASFQSALDATLADGGDCDWHFKFRVVHRDGRVRWADTVGKLSVAVQLDGTTAPVRFSGLVYDVTDQIEAERRLAASQRALREAEERLLLAMSSSSLGWWDVNPQTHEVYWSPSTRRLFDIDGDDESAPLSDPVSRMHPDDRERVSQAIGRAMSGEGDGAYHEEYRVIWRDGSVHWVDAIGQAHIEEVDGERRVVRFAGVLWEVTDQKRHLDALREASRQKDVFLATLAHELRNPLAPVRTAAHLLAQAAHEPDRVRWASDVIQRQVGHMSRLLEDLMDIARITRGRLTLQRQEVVLGDVVHTAIESAQGALDKRGHTLVVEMPSPRSTVHIDPVRMSQVVSNLLTNAAKYTDRGGRIVLSATLEGDEAVFQVADNGIGLDPERLESIFDMFAQREEALSRSEGGLGIGLALVRGLVALHGGTVRARSAGRGQGSTFVVRVPAAVSKAREATDRDTARAQRARPLSILVADDNRDAADTLAALLEVDGHAVQVAYGGREALELASRSAPDVALLDIGMPDLSGYEAAQRLRADGPDRLCLAALSGWGRPEDEARAHAAGFDRHFTKPVDAPALLRWLADVATARANL